MNDTKLNTSRECLLYDIDRAIIDLKLIKTMLLKMPSVGAPQRYTKPMERKANFVKDATFRINRHLDEIEKNYRERKAGLAG